MEQENIDIFNLNVDDFVETKAVKKEQEFYRPDPKNGKDGVYKSLIRFVPFYKDPKKSKINKYSYWLTDPISGDGFSVDCPTTVGQKSFIYDTYWKLKKSNSVAEQKLSESFRRKENHYALVQIIKDDNDPELVGKIKIFKFGMKLNNIFQSELQPEYGRPYNPFDPFKGRIMALTVTTVAGWSNYDSSKFVGDEAAPILNGKALEKNAESMSAFTEFLKKNSPDLSKYDYVEMTDEIKERVKTIIEKTVPSMRSTEAVQKEASRSQNISIPSTPSSAPAPDTKQVSLDDLNLDDVNNDDFDQELYSGL